MHHLIHLRALLDSDWYPACSLVFREQAGSVLVQAHALSVILVETVSFLAHSAALKASGCILTTLSGTLPRVSFAVDSRRIFSFGVQSIHVSVAVVGRYSAARLALGRTNDEPVLAWFAPRV
jgi:hypothetical protein